MARRQCAAFCGCAGNRAVALVPLLLGATRRCAGDTAVALVTCRKSAALGNGAGCSLPVFRPCRKHHAAQQAEKTKDCRKPFHIIHPILVFLFILPEIYEKTINCLHRSSLFWWFRFSQWHDVSAQSPGRGKRTGISSSEKGENHFLDIIVRAPLMLGFCSWICRTSHRPHLQQALSAPFGRWCNWGSKKDHGGIPTVV